MLRTLIAVVTVYGYAQPALTAIAPLLEKPLQAFSLSISTGAQQGQRALAVFDKARLWHYADLVIERVSAEWHGAKKT